MAMAATVTIGGMWPDGTHAPQGDVVIWSGEDSPDDTLIPRLIQSGADLSRIHFVSGAGRKTFDPAKDVSELEKVLQSLPNAKMLIMDPISQSILGDSHKNTDVRRGLQPLINLAASCKLALLGITHFTKGSKGNDPLDRITGSVAFGAVARVVMVAATPKQDGASRILVRAKSNIGPDGDGFEYDLCQGELTAHPGICTSYALWGDAIEGSARELLAVADEPIEDRSVENDSKALLRDLRIYAESNKAKAYPTVELLAYLNGSEAMPWSDYCKGKPLTARKLADLLRPHRIVSTTIRMPNGTTPKGYKANSIL
jgi:hypothetical protein